MSAFDLLYAVSGGTAKPKRLPSAASTVDFLSIKIGSSAIEIKQVGANLDHGGVKLVNVVGGTASGEVLTWDQIGANNGVAGLDSGGKVPVSQLPNSVMEYKGTYDPTGGSGAGTPALADGTGNAGDVYRVTVAGSHNFGSGSITFVVGDYVIYNGTIWEKSHSGADAVTSVNGLAGVVVLTTTNIAEGTNLYYTQARFDTAFGAKSTTDLAEGTNLYYTNARFDTRFGTKTTTDLAEGTNLYFTNARAQTAVVVQTINSGDTTHATSADALFTALAAKQDAATAYQTFETDTNDQGGSVAQTIRQLVYLSSAGKVKKALAADITGPHIRLLMVKDTSINDQASGSYWKKGATVPGFTSLDITKPIYASHGTSGGFQQDLTGYAAGDAVVILGKVLSATTIEFDPQYLYEY